MKTDENAPVTREELKADICKNADHTNRRADELKTYIDEQIDGALQAFARAIYTLLDELQDPRVISAGRLDAVKLRDAFIKRLSQDRQHVPDFERRLKAALEASQ